MLRREHAELVESVDKVKADNEAAAAAKEAAEREVESLKVRVEMKSRAEKSTASLLAKERQDKAEAERLWHCHLYHRPERGRCPLRVKGCNALAERAALAVRAA